MIIVGKNLSSVLRKHIEAENKKFTSSSSLVSSNNAGQIDKNVAKNFGNLVKKFQALSASDNVAMKKHIDAINATKGDYSRRNPKIAEKVKYMVTFANDLLQKNRDLDGTSIGLFVRSWNILRSPQFVVGCRKAYENMHDGGSITTASFYGVIYTSLVLYLEIVTMYLIPYEFQFAFDNGLYSKKLTEDFQEDHGAFVKSVCFGIASIVAFVENQKNLSTVINKGIEEERDMKSKAKEAAFFAVPIYVAAVAIVGAALGLFALRQMFYWFANFKVDVAHLLEFEAELLTNNIRNLKDQYDSEQNPDTKKRLAVIIEKQERWQDRFKKMSRGVLAEEVKATYETNDELESEDRYDSSKQEAGEPEIFL